MMTTNMAGLPFEFNSPVEFVLVGQLGSERGVLAQSKDAKLDLVAFAQVPGRQLSGRRSILPVFLEPQPMAVSSPPVESEPVSPRSDRRAWALTFVWRATGSAQDVRLRELLEYSLAKHSPDIVDAINSGSASRIGFALGEPVGICSAHERRVLRRRRLALAILGLYLSMLLAALAVLMLKP